MTWARWRYPPIVPPATPSTIGRPPAIWTAPGATGVETRSAGVEAAPYFALLAKLARENGVAGLSMGMSDDLEAAVMLGATHVRVGSALFGARA